MNQFEHLVAEKCFQSSCIEEMREEIARNYCDHQLKIIRSNADLTGKFFKLPMRGMTLNYLSYGTDVAIDAGDFETFYMLEFPLSGSVELSLDNTEYRSGNYGGTLLSPGYHVRSKWSADCAQLMLKIEKEALHRYLQDTITRDIKSSIVFSPEVRFDSGPGSALFSYLRFIIEQSFEDDTILMSSMVREEVESTIFAILIDRLAHSYSEAVRAEQALILPYHVSRAYKYINANARSPISNEELARISSVSIRTLYAGFNKFLGMSPQNYLRCYRLDRVKEELERVDRPVQISEIAHEWGFTHMGRFSREFRQRFGVTPSSFLRR